MIRVEEVAIMFNFEKLAVWQKAVEYADFVYKMTRNFPTDERFGLTSQLRRSAVSVSANLAEGSSRSSKTDMARFIEIAYGSLLESVTNFEIAKRQEFLSPGNYADAYKRAETLAKMLSGLRRTIKVKKAPIRSQPSTLISSNR
jgi:four helix bundle protein